MSTPGVSKPEELVLDEDTGVFSLTNKANIKTTYVVDVTITNTDGTNTQTVVI